jgi:hypothetical protein
VQFGNGQVVRHPTRLRRPVDPLDRKQVAVSGQDRFAGSCSLPPFPTERTWQVMNFGRPLGRALYRPGNHRVRSALSSYSRTESNCAKTNLE